MRKSESSEKSAVVPADAVLLSPSSDKKAAKALENIKAKYAHVDTRMIWRAGDGKHLSHLSYSTWFNPQQIPRHPFHQSSAPVRRVIRACIGHSCHKSAGALGS